VNIFKKLLLLFVCVGMHAGLSAGNVVSDSPLYLGAINRYLEKGDPGSRRGVERFSKGKGKFVLGAEAREDLMKSVIDSIQDEKFLSANKNVKLQVILFGLEILARKVLEAAKAENNDDLDAATREIIEIIRHDLVKQAVVAIGWSSAISVLGGLIWIGDQANTFRGTAGLDKLLLEKKPEGKELVSAETMLLNKEQQEKLNKMVLDLKKQNENLIKELSAQKEQGTKESQRFAERISEIEKTTGLQASDELRKVTARLAEQESRREQALEQAQQEGTRELEDLKMAHTKAMNAKDGELEGMRKQLDAEKEGLRRQFDDQRADATDKYKQLELAKNNIQKELKLANDQLTKETSESAERLNEFLEQKRIADNYERNLKRQLKDQQAQIEKIKKQAEMNQKNRKKEFDSELKKTG